jgi:very-short-patch-repair endonuclease
VAEVPGSNPGAPIEGASVRFVGLWVDGMHAHLRELAAAQADVVASWQLVERGWSRDRISHAARRGGWRRLHAGVHLLSQSPPTRRQRWMAATLTAPGTVLSHASAGALWGFRPWEAGLEIVTRPGGGGPRMVGKLLVCRSRHLAERSTRHHGIPVTLAAHALCDLAGHLGTEAMARCVREALRLGCTSPELVLAAAVARRGRGCAHVAELARRYADVPYTRTRANSEARALEVLRDAGVQRPEVNVEVGGFEADLVWRERRVIVEIDGPQFHRFADEDERRDRCWRAAGYDVRRIPSTEVFDRPERLVALVAECPGEDSNPRHPA